MNVKLSFPKEFFTQEFLKIANSELGGIRGDHLPGYLNEKVEASKREKGLFSPKFYYDCKSVNGNTVVLVGSNN